ncbi:hypothetical protein TL16_g02650 [Triparma laevis f. inornata]|uniref:E3 ubiquitin-protein ligase n=1 Tax=Triparma laevis f. inornata TaxID=1714386 RepID=A0A9W6ZY74_9STRA|nr:hypothetical protein TL16_g02650 [Triparma laevis f. inornata]
MSIDDLNDEYESLLSEFETEYALNHRKNERIKHCIIARTKFLTDRQRKDGDDEDGLNKFEDVENSDEGFDMTGFEAANPPTLFNFGRKGGTEKEPYSYGNIHAEPPEKNPFNPTRDSFLNPTLPHQLSFLPPNFPHKYLTAKTIDYISVKYVTTLDDFRELLSASIHPLTGPRSIPNDSSTPPSGGSLSPHADNVQRLLSSILYRFYVKNFPPLLKFQETYNKIRGDMLPSSLRHKVYDTKELHISQVRGCDYPPNLQFLLFHISAHYNTAPLKIQPCGYIFQPGDIAWNCRTCQSDPTCVLCNACFQASDHEGHDVQFHRTQPGGCCDCGDTDAWKVEGCCPKHRPAKVPETYEELLKQCETDGDACLNQFGAFKKVLKIFVEVLMSQIANVGKEAQGSACKLTWNYLISSEITQIRLCSPNAPFSYHPKLQRLLSLGLPPPPPGPSPPPPSPPDSPSAYTEDMKEAKKLTGEVDKIGEVTVETFSDFTSANKCFDHFNVTSGLFTSALSHLQMDSSRLSTYIIEVLDLAVHYNSPHPRDLVAYTLCDYLTSPLPPLQPSNPQPSPHWFTGLSTYAYAVTQSDDSSYLISDTDFRPFFGDDIQSCSKPWETEGIDHSRNDDIHKFYAQHQVIYRRIIGDDYVPSEPSPSSSSIPHYQNVTLTPTQYLLLNDSYFLRSTRGVLHNLFLSLLTLPRVKKTLGESVMVSYKTLASEFTAGVGCEDTGVFFSNVQIFTNSSLVKYLNSGSCLGNFSLNDIVFSCIYKVVLGGNVSMIEDDIKEYGIERHTGSDKVLSPTKFMSDGFLKSRCFLFRRVPSLMRDLEYILESLSLSEDRRTLVDIQHSTLSQYSDLLKLSQGCNPLCRQTDPSHVLFEDQYWVQALSHDLSLGGISDAICKDDKAWGHLVRKLKDWIYRTNLLPHPTDYSYLDVFKLQAVHAKALKNHPSPLQSSYYPNWKSRVDRYPGYPLTLSKEFVRTFDEHPDSMLEFPFDGMKNDHVLFHLPMNRALAYCLRAFCERIDSEEPQLLKNFSLAQHLEASCEDDPSPRVGIPDSFEQNTPALSPSEIKSFKLKVATCQTKQAIVDFPVRAIVAWRQITGGMWRRNGNAAFQLVLNYSTPPLCRSLRHLDLLLVQFSASENNDAALGAQKLWKLLVDRFALNGFATDLEGPDPLDGGMDLQPGFLAPQDKDHPPTMMLSFFETMNQIVTELPLTPSTPRVNFSHTARREYIHKVLLGKQASRSELRTAVMNGATNGEGGLPSYFEEVFTEVFEEIGAGDKSKKIPSQIKDEYDPSFYHLSRANHQTAMEKVSADRKGKIVPLVTRLKPPHKLFEKTRDVLKIEESFSAIRRWLLFAILGGEWAPNKEKNLNFSPKTIQESPVSILEVLQFCTLQFYEVFASPPAARPEAIKAYLTGITSTKITLPPDAWIFAQLPTPDPHGLRPSVLGMLGIIYEFWVCAEGEKQVNQTTAQPQQSSEDHNSGARELVISGLTWLLRAIKVLMSEPTLELDGISSSVQRGARTSSTSSSFNFPDLPDLWPQVEDAQKSADGADDADPGSAKKKQYKAAQAKAMARIKAQQSKVSHYDDEAQRGAKRQADNVSLFILARSEVTVAMWPFLVLLADNA